MSLIIFAIMQIKMAGMEVKDFWSFIKANEDLDKLYILCFKLFDKQDISWKNQEFM